jgi:hypothetical protein
MNEQSIKSRKKPVILLITMIVVFVAMIAYFLVPAAMYSLFGETAVAKVTHKKQESRTSGKPSRTYEVIVFDYSFQEASGAQREGRDEAALGWLSGHEDTVTVEYVPGFQYASRLKLNRKNPLLGALVPIFMLVVFSVFLVLNVMHNSSLSQGLEPLAEGGAPKFSSDALVCRYPGWMNKPVSVIVDNTAGTLHLQNCHYPEAFLPKKAQPWFSCPLNELREVRIEKVKYRGSKSVDALRIVTRSGSALILPDATDFKSLCDQFQRIPKFRGL